MTTVMIINIISLSINLTFTGKRSIQVKKICQGMNVSFPLKILCFPVEIIISHQMGKGRRKISIERLNKTS